jgi:hypothetical protein
VSNITDFNDATAYTFATLYSNFPKPITLRPEEVSKGAFGGDAEESQNAAYNAVQWLSQNGFISVRSWTIDGSAHLCTLTLKGLQILNQVPETISGEKKLGEQIVDATKAGGKGLARKLVDVAIQKGAELLLSAGANGGLGG